jgi:hypothetical protein
MREPLKAALSALLLIAVTTDSLAQQPQPPIEATKPESTAAVGPQPFVTYPLATVLGTHGYFEVTPAGSLVFYPTWTAIDPGVMQTIFAMMGATSLVGQRGHYQVGSDQQVRFFLPPGTTPGFFDPRFSPPIRPYQKPPDGKQ